LEKFFGGNMFVPKAIKDVREKSDVGGVIQKYADSSYHVTQTLKDFVNNNFQTIEDIRYRKTRKQAWVGIFVAIVTGITSLIIGVISIYLSCKY
jgi:hypothetical protein